VEPFQSDRAGSGWGWSLRFASPALKDNETLVAIALAQDICPVIFVNGHALALVEDAQAARLLFVAQKFETGHDNTSLPFLYTNRLIDGSALACHALIHHWAHDIGPIQADPWGTAPQPSLTAIPRECFAPAGAENSRSSFHVDPLAVNARCGVQRSTPAASGIAATSLQTCPLIGVLHVAEFTKTANIMARACSLAFRCRLCQNGTRACRLECGRS
jgi:hypothetical protein